MRVGIECGVQPRWQARGDRVHDNTARLWDAETGTEIAVLKGHEHSVWSAAFSPDGRRVVTASSDNTARLWDVSRSEVARRGGALMLVAALAQGIG